MVVTTTVAFQWVSTKRVIINPKTYVSATTMIGLGPLLSKIPKNALSGRFQLNGLRSFSTWSPETHGPVTVFTEDEEMTRHAVRIWAREALQHIVREIDNEEKIRPELLHSLFY